MSVRCVMFGHRWRFSRVIQGGDVAYCLVCSVTSSGRNAAREDQR